MNIDIGNKGKPISIDEIAIKTGKTALDVLGLNVGSLFDKYSKNGQDALKLAVCGACVLEVEKTGRLYLAKFQNDGESVLYPPDATLGGIILAHCKCSKYQ